MSTRHLSSQFDMDLNKLSAQLMEMGGHVEVILSLTLTLLKDNQPELLTKIRDIEQEVNRAELILDAACIDVIARRQPTARDLRLVLAISKAVTNLERAGDESVKIAKNACRLLENEAHRVIGLHDLVRMANLSQALLRDTLDAFARLDANKARELIAADKVIDLEFKGFMRKLLTFMLEDPRCISSALDFMNMAKAIERVGDHAKNIAQFLIFVVDGLDVRHSKIERNSTEDL